jgi:UDP-N-acetylmuramoylalanine--D-glutamate ligase
VRWISEPELAVRFFAGPLIAVTGTNGKTTTTLLIGHLLEQAGIRAAVGGNVGGGLAPAASDLALLDEPPEWYVLEMSSFQLAGVESFRPDIGVVTNLQPDHLDRYASVAEYYADKAHLFDRADAASRWVLPAGDREVADLAGDAPGERYWFGGDGTSATHAFVQDGTLTLRVQRGAEAMISLAELPLLGRHNVDNALAAALTARLAGAEPAGIAAGLRSARPLPHRLEPVADSGGVLWVNDSKATNVAATKSALASVDRPVVILLGGKDKGEPFAPLADALATRARAVIAYGAVGPRVFDELHHALRSELGDRVPVELMGSDFAAVVARAAQLAEPGDMVLLSPACSSYDMFDHYEHRGRRFAELARRFAEEVA